MTDPILPTDSDLLEGIRAGDPATLSSLQTAYWAPLVRFARGIVEGRADPQDVVQEAFIRLWTHRERWDARGSVRSLLYTVTRNAALDQLRRHGRQERAAGRMEPPTAPRAPAEDAAAEELRRAAAAAVEALPPKRREVFRLARVEGLSYPEIAEVMGLAQQTVANHMSLALADLRLALRAFLPDDRPPP
ncbi:MAG: RNA polymerase sigma-70 factor [Gemmatimonadota bacterium]|jgi:RNA polymerase sigma-70 factor (ECF subfamily)